MRCLHKYIAIAAALCLLWGCLPERLTEEEIDDKVIEALCGSTDVPADDNESCYDGNKSACDGCENCGARRVFNTTEQLDVVIVQTAGYETLKTTAQDSFSVSFWFKPKKSLVDGHISTILIRGKEGSKRVLVVGIMGAPGGNAVVPACIMNGKKSPHKAGDEVIAYDSLLKVDQWHHIICAYNGAERKVGVAADLGQLKEVSSNLPKGAKGQLFEDDDMIAIGHIEFGTGVGKKEAGFVGLIDEVRWSNTYPASPPVLKRRYDDNLADTVFLFHMDGPAAGADYQIKSANGMLTAATLDITHKLDFANDNCFDTDGWALLCELAESPPKWCDDVQQ